MKIIDPKDAQFEILAATSDAERLVERAGRTCYKSEDRITLESAAKFTAMLRRRGHWSVLEHASVTVRFWNVSRGLTHELVRHRLASYSQRSTRYVREEEMTVIMPTEEVLPEVRECLENVERLYHTLISDHGWNPEDARQLLPTGLATEIVVTANFREWLHIFRMRTAHAAHWEIRRLMERVRLEFSRLWPSVFGGELSDA